MEYNLIVYVNHSRQVVEDTYIRSKKGRTCSFGFVILTFFTSN